MAWSLAWAEEWWGVVSPARVPPHADIPSGRCCSWARGAPCSTSRPQLAARLRVVHQNQVGVCRGGACWRFLGGFLPGRAVFWIGLHATCNVRLVLAPPYHYIHIPAARPHAVRCPVYCNVCPTDRFCTAISLEARDLGVARGARAVGAVHEGEGVWDARGPWLAAHCLLCSSCLADGCSCAPSMIIHQRMYMNALQLHMTSTQFLTLQVCAICHTRSRFRDVIHHRHSEMLATGRLHDRSSGGADS